LGDALSLLQYGWILKRLEDGIRNSPRHALDARALGGPSGNVPGIGPSRITLAALTTIAG
jgi:hypothetical protein